jgi:hypothetical protein
MRLRLFLGYLLLLAFGFFELGCIYLEQLGIGIGIGTGTLGTWHLRS